MTLYNNMKRKTERNKRSIRIFIEIRRKRKKKEDKQRDGKGLLKERKGPNKKWNKFKNGVSLIGTWDLENNTVCSIGMESQ